MNALENSNSYNVLILGSAKDLTTFFFFFNLSLKVSLHSRCHYLYFKGEETHTWGD